MASHLSSCSYQGPLAFGLSCILQGHHDHRSCICVPTDTAGHRLCQRYMRLACRNCLPALSRQVQAFLPVSISYPVPYVSGTPDHLHFPFSPIPGSHHENAFCSSPPWRINPFAFPMKLNGFNLEFITVLHAKIPTFLVLSRKAGTYSRGYERIKGGLCF